MLDISIIAKPFKKVNLLIFYTNCSVKLKKFKNSTISGSIEWCHKKQYWTHAIENSKELHLNIMSAPKIKHFWCTHFVKQLRFLGAF